MATEVHTKLFHRFPFVLFDRALATEPGASQSARLLSVDDSLHEGAAGTTFAQSLLVEAMAQTAALFAEEAGRKRSGMLVGLNRVRFGRAPRPGDRLIVEARFVQKFGDIIRVAGRVTESGEMLAEGDILISLGSE
jgi:3-hydroxymyristoyl/3-hydroxydecanoyl-(acyl carrier protein) dehydratase